jgi:hypothetical protein
MNVKYKKYIDYIVKDIELPYLKSLKPYGLKQEEMDLVLSKVFNQPVHYIEPMHGVYNKDKNRIYHENSNGFWERYEYNDQGKRTYYEDSICRWYKKEYDQYGNVIYYENSDGDIID